MAEHTLLKKSDLPVTVEVAVKGSILTTKTWFLLIGAALLISAGLLNFRQRVGTKHHRGMV